MREREWGERDFRGEDGIGGVEEGKGEERIEKEIGGERGEVGGVTGEIRWRGGKEGEYIYCLM